jgi:hypothetical protein
VKLAVQSPLVWTFVAVPLHVTPAPLGVEFVVGNAHDPPDMIRDATKKHDFRLSEREYLN